MTDDTNETSGFFNGLNLGGYSEENRKTDLIQNARVELTELWDENIDSLNGDLKTRPAGQDYPDDFLERLLGAHMLSNFEYDVGTDPDLDMSDIPPCFYNKDAFSNLDYFLRHSNLDDLSADKLEGVLMAEIDARTMMLAEAQRDAKENYLARKDDKASERTLGVIMQKYDVYLTHVQAASDENDNKLMR